MTHLYFDLFDNKIYKVDVKVNGLKINLKVGVFDDVRNTLQM